MIGSVDVEIERSNGNATVDVSDIELASTTFEQESGFMTDVPKAAWAGAKWNGDFYSVETYSGYRSQIADPQGIEFLLPADVSSVELGHAVLGCLSKSRFVLPAIAPELFDYKAIGRRYEQWVKELSGKFKYPNRKALFKRMKSCSISRQANVLTIEASNHSGSESWDRFGISDSTDILIPADSSAAEIGEALKSAFQRCT